MKLYPFQKDAVDELLDGKHIVIAVPGAGKSAITLAWAREMQRKTGKSRLVVWTTSAKAHTTDWQDEAKNFAPDMQLESFEVVSWHMAKKWCSDKTPAELSEYLFIADECLPANTKVKTISGEKEISDVKVGDKVLSYNHQLKRAEYKTVSRTIKKASPQKMIRLNLSNGTAIISTDNHPHYTDDGYKEAKDIKAGDTLYEKRSMHKTKICTDKSSKIWGVHRVWFMPCKNISSDAETKPTVETKRGEKELLLKEMRENSDKQEWQKSDGKKRAQRDTAQKSDRENGKKQPFDRPTDKSKNDGDKESEWMATDMGKTSRNERGEWKNYRATNQIIRGIRKEMQRVDNGIASEDWWRGRIPNLLQARHRQRILQDRSGVRWRRTQWSKSQSKRQEKDQQISPVRVESIEVLKLSDIKRFRLYREPDYVYCLDVEGNHNFFANGVLTHNCQKAKAGVSSQMGKAFLLITKYTDTWVGATGTPGDNWIDFYPYFQADKKIRNKTQFQREYCIMQRYPFPAIVKYINTDQLKQWWNGMTTAPDTATVMAQLPAETHQVLKFPAPKGYKKVLKTSTTLDGEFLDSNMALLHELRQMCATPDKLSALSDLLESLSSPLVVFYNYTTEREQILELARKLKRKVWRVDGERHEIPTAETIGEKDIVLCHYLSGSEALNLQFCNYWLSYSYNYSYSTSLQARGRIKRIGQANHMHYYYFETEDTIEQEVKKALKSKSDFAEETWRP